MRIRGTWTHVGDLIQRRRSVEGVENEFNLPSTCSQAQRHELKTKLNDLAQVVLVNNRDRFNRCYRRWRFFNDFLDRRRHAYLDPLAGRSNFFHRSGRRLDDGLVRSDENVRTMKSSNLKQSSGAEPPTLSVFAFFRCLFFVP
jgi:hypothetical protein